MTLDRDELVRLDPFQDRWRIVVEAQKLTGDDMSDATPGLNKKLRAALRYIERYQQKENFSEIEAADQWLFLDCVSGLSFVSGDLRRRLLGLREIPRKILSRDRYDYLAPDLRDRMCSLYAMKRLARLLPISCWLRALVKDLKRRMSELQSLVSPAEVELRHVLRLREQLSEEISDAADRLIERAKGKDIEDIAWRRLKEYHLVLYDYLSDIQKAFIRENIETLDAQAAHDGIVEAIVSGDLEQGRKLLETAARQYPDRGEVRSARQKLEHCERTGELFSEIAGAIDRGNVRETIDLIGALIGHYNPLLDPREGDLVLPEAERSLIDRAASVHTLRIESNESEAMLLFSKVSKLLSSGSWIVQNPQIRWALEESRRLVADLLMNCWIDELRVRSDEDYRCMYETYTAPRYVEVIRCLPEHRFKGQLELYRICGLISSDTSMSLRWEEFRPETKGGIEFRVPPPDDVDALLGLQALRDADKSSLRYKLNEIRRRASEITIAEKLVDDGRLSEARVLVRRIEKYEPDTAAMLESRIRESEFVGALERGDFDRAVAMAENEKDDSWLMAAETLNRLVGIKESFDLERLIDVARELQDASVFDERIWTAYKGTFDAIMSRGLQRIEEDHIRSLRSGSLHGVDCAIEAAEALRRSQLSAGLQDAIGGLIQAMESRRPLAEVWDAMLRGLLSDSRRLLDAFPVAGASTAEVERRVAEANLTILELEESYDSDVAIELVGPLSSLEEAISGESANRLVSLAAGASDCGFALQMRSSGSYRMLDAASKDLITTLVLLHDKKYSELDDYVESLRIVLPGVLKRKSREDVEDLARLEAKVGDRVPEHFEPHLDSIKGFWNRVCVGLHDALQRWSDFGRSGEADRDAKEDRSLVSALESECSRLADTIVWLDSRLKECCKTELDEFKKRKPEIDRVLGAFLLLFERLDECDRVHDYQPIGVVLEEFEGQQLAEFPMYQRLRDQVRQKRSRYEELRSLLERTMSPTSAESFVVAHTGLLARCETYDYDCGEDKFGLGRLTGRGTLKAYLEFCDQAGEELKRLDDLARDLSRVQPLDVNKCLEEPNQHPELQEKIRDTLGDTGTRFILQGVGEGRHPVVSLKLEEVRDRMKEHWEKTREAIRYR